MAEKGGALNGTGKDSRSRETTIVTSIGGNGKIRASAVVSTGNKEQDEERARRALRTPDTSADDLLRRVNGDN